MAMEIANLGLPRFGIGAVLSASVFVFKRNLLQFLLLGAIFVLPTYALGLATIFSFIKAGRNVNSIADISPGLMIIFLFLMFVTVAFYFLYSSATIYGALRCLHDQKARIGQCIGQAFRALSQVIGANFLLGLAFLLVIFVASIFTVGFALLSQAITGKISEVMLTLPSLIAIPVALFLVICCWILVPVIVMERPGILKSLRRSFILTVGQRWRILGILLIVGAAAVAVEFILFVFALFSPWLAGVLALAANTFLIIWIMILPAIGYGLLVNEKEGSAVKIVAKVFE